MLPVTTFVDARGVEISGVVKNIAVRVCQCVMLLPASYRDIVAFDFDYPFID